MARPERNDVAPARAPLSSPAARYLPGGQVGQMHADLVHRLARESVAWNPTSLSLDEEASEQPGERLVRLVSVAGGYVALLAAYAGMLLLILR